MADRTRDGGVEERTEGQRLLLYKGVLARALNLHRDQKSLARTGERWKMAHRGQPYRVFKLVHYGRQAVEHSESKHPSQMTPRMTI